MWSSGPPPSWCRRAIAWRSQSAARTTSGRPRPAPASRTSRTSCAAAARSCTTTLATYRVNVALALKGMKVDEEVSIDLLKGQQLNSDYRAVNPQAVVPSLVLDDG